MDLGQVHNTLQMAGTFVLVLVRIAGMMIFAPLFGSGRIPGRVKALMTIALALGASAALPGPLPLPPSLWQAAGAIAGELAFGLGVGIVASLVFIAAQWGGELIGQQMGLSIGAVFDPQFGQSSSIIGDLYFLLTLAIFLLIGGHQALLGAVLSSMVVHPPLTLGLDASLLGVVLDMLTSATVLAMKLGAPMLLTMLMVDVVLGALSKTMPQLNIMTAGLSLRTLLGVVVLVAGLAMTVKILGDELTTMLGDVADLYAEAPIG